MDWTLVDRARKARVLILVSKFGHCLNDIPFRVATQHLPVEVVGHRQQTTATSTNSRPATTSPSTTTHRSAPRLSKGRGKSASSIELIDEQQVDLVVLARYMQILSPELCERLSGRAINIHHSFLPSFRAPAPTTRPHERGVKLIGATAHYVTSDLDEGPIIEQEVSRIDHSYGPEQLAAVGRDTECLALARAIQWHAEHRVLLNGKRTVVFR